MVLKKKKPSSKNPKFTRKQENPNNSQSKKKEQSPFNIFQEMNKKVKDYSFFQVGQIYDLFIMSKKFFKNWQKTKEIKQDEIINSDLINTNYFQFKETILIEEQNFVLKNFLEPEIDYIPVDNKAWEYAVSIFTTLPIKKSFFFDENGYLNDINKGISLNVLINDKENELTQSLYQFFHFRNLKNFFSQICPQEDFQFLIENTFLIDSRITLQKFKYLLNQKIINGIHLNNKEHYPLANLKEHDIIFINLDKNVQYQINTSLENKIGFCYYCREEKHLDFDCTCKIVSYCQLDCKYEDHLIHYDLCNQIENHLSDYKNDQKLFSINKNEGLIGLTNIGNSCYLNSLLQILKFIFNEKILKKIDFEKIKNSQILLSFYHMMEKLWFSKSKSIKPWFFKIFLGLLHENYLTYLQNDAHECLMNIIDSLKETKIEEIKFFTDKFKGYLSTFIICNNCQNIIEKKEKFYIISLPIKAEKLTLSFEFYKLENFDNYLNYEFVLSQFTLNSCSTLKNLLENNQFDKGFLIFANKEKIINIFTDLNSPLMNIYNEISTFKIQGAFYLYNLDIENYLGLSFTIQKPTLDKYNDKKILLGNFRIYDFPIFNNISSRCNIHQHIFSLFDKYSNMTTQYPFYDNLLHEKKNEDFLNYFYMKLFGIPILTKNEIKNKFELFQLKDFIETKMKDFEFSEDSNKNSKEKDSNKDKIGNKKIADKKNLKCKTKKKDLKTEQIKEKKILKNSVDKNCVNNIKNGKLPTKSEILKKHKDLWNEEYSQLKQQHDILLDKYLKDLEKVEKLPNEFIYKVKYINTETICKNCGKKGNHNCNLLFDDKKLIIKKNPLQINIEFEKKDKFTPLIKAQFKKEMNIQYNADISKKTYNLQSCINTFCEEEEVEFKCNKCENPSSKMSTKITAFPTILVLHLKRFESIYKNNKLKHIKIEKKVDIHFDLEFGDYKYKLIGVVNHKGELNRGHYNNYSYNDILGKWIFFNDEEVEVIDDINRINSDLNYILFYKLILSEDANLHSNQNMNNIQSNMNIEVINPNINEKSETEVIDEIEIRKFPNQFDENLTGVFKNLQEDIEIFVNDQNQEIEKELNN